MTAASRLSRAIVAALAVAAAMASACAVSTLSIGADYVSLPMQQREIQNASDRGYRLARLAGGPWFHGLLFQRSAGDPEPVEYLLISTQRVRTTVREMNEAAGRGYRFAAGGVIQLVMQRKSGISTGTYEYEILQTRLLQTLEDELQSKARQGFHVVDATLTGHTILEADEFNVILERAAGVSLDDPRAYRLVSTARVETFQQELQQAADDGYRLNPALRTGTGRVLVEKMGRAASPVDYLVLSTSRTGTMQSELNRASGEGYHFVTTFSGVLTGALRGSQLAVVMERAKGSTTRTHEQVLLATSQFKTLLRELRAELAKGFRLVGRTIFDPPGVLGVTPMEEVAILERSVHSQREE